MLNVRCQSVSHECVDLCRPTLAAGRPPRASAIGKLVVGHKLIEDGQWQLPQRLVNADAVF
jgi:hypothetical protein